MSHANDAGGLDTAAVARPGAFFGQITTTVRHTACELLKERLSTMGASACPRVLDVGCGNALLFAELGASDAYRIGSDLDRQLLKEAGSLFDANRIDGVGRVHADAGALPFASGSVDVACFLNTLINIPTDEDVTALMGELSRVCRPGGRLFVDIRNGSNLLLRIRYWLNNLTADFTTRGYRIPSLAAVFASLGCRIEAVHPIPGRFPVRKAGFLLEIVKETES